MASQLTAGSVLLPCLRLRNTIIIHLNEQKFTLQMMEAKERHLEEAMGQHEGDARTDRWVRQQELIAHRPQLKLLRKALKRALYEIKDLANERGVFFPDYKPTETSVPRIVVKRDSGYWLSRPRSAADLIQEAEALVSEVDAFLSDHLEVWHGLLFDMERLWPSEE
ncbi:MAG: hypothetical protein Q9170_003723 [Blastenia crenularia]